MISILQKLAPQGSTLRAPQLPTDAEGDIGFDIPSHDVRAAMTMLLRLC